MTHIEQLIIVIEFILLFIKTIIFDKKNIIKKIHTNINLRNHVLFYF